MRRVIALLIFISAIAVPVHGMEFTAPAVPEQGQQFMPDDTDNLGEGLWFVISAVLAYVQPSIKAATGVCVSVIALSLITGLLSELSGNTNKAIILSGTAAVSISLLRPTNTLIQLGVETVQQISQYGRLLLPTLTGALAAQGAVTKSGALYVATAFFDALLTSTIVKYLVPLVYIFICVSIGSRIFKVSIMQDIRKFIKWILTWGLKIILYVFTGYMSITGVVGGTTDAALLKATKLTISGMVPVVGNILSDASEAILVSAALMKNAVGLYGLFAVISLWVGPFVRIGAQYLMLKATTGVCGMFAAQPIWELMKDFCDAMGLMLAMTGTVCLIFLISIICYMRGVG